MSEVVSFTGDVEWSGENPAIYLKQEDSGPFTTLASFFRVVLSPHGPGHALILLQSPAEATPEPGARNYCLHDNELLARYLVEHFVAHFAAFRDLPSLQHLEYRRAERVQATNEMPRRYSEEVRGGDLTVRMTWGDLESPFCFALPPDKSATGKHYMPSLFVGCGDAMVEVNGVRRRGRPSPRDVAGHVITTAMLAFSETWVRAST
jgi:hypothetical protein